MHAKDLLCPCEIPGGDMRAAQSFLLAALQTALQLFAAEMHPSETSDLCEKSIFSLRLPAIVSQALLRLCL